jgi:hypothetical protein
LQDLLNISSWLLMSERPELIGGSVFCACSNITLTQARMRQRSNVQALVSIPCGGPRSAALHMSIALRAAVRLQ